MASEAPVIRLVNQILSRAVETQASDIHIEPFEDRLRVRYRHDGVLHEADNPPGNLAAAITSRIKIMAKLDIAERRLPQDGRIRLAVRGQEIDFRVSTVPSLYGETVVMRILDRTAVEFDYAKLGLPPTIIDQFKTALALPNGIVLVTGPTGSGKTTTLYTGLLALNSIERKIMTVEDPIEFRLHGITQMQVHEQIGLTFEEFLSAIVRQDPNVIMVGEIRNRETAQIAANAALLGRLVLSTLHTNSAAAAVTRLRDMGLEDYTLAAVLRGVLAQRLVRRLCHACRRPAPASHELVRRLNLEAGGDGVEPTLYHAVGCPECRQSGYRGRFAVAEFLTLNAEIEQLIFSRADHNSIERAAMAARHEIDVPVRRGSGTGRRDDSRGSAARPARGELSHGDVPVSRDRPHGRRPERHHGRGIGGRGDRAPAAARQHPDARRAGHRRLLVQRAVAWRSRQQGAEPPAAGRRQYHARAGHHARRRPGSRSSAALPARDGAARAHPHRGGRAA